MTKPNTAGDVLKDTSAQFFDNLKWLTTKEAAFYLRVSVGQLRNMVYRRQLKAYHLKNRLRFLRSDLDRLIKPQVFLKLKEFWCLLNHIKM